jgi:signal transduction histidine kinase
MEKASKEAGGTDPAERTGWRRAVTYVLATLALVLAVSAIGLGIANGSFERDPGIFLTILIILMYAAVGALLAARKPRDPIGWLFLAVGLGLLFGGATTEYATHAIVTAPGELPFGRVAAWIGGWAFLFIAAIPLILLLFPTGSPPSPRWRWLPWTIVCSTAGMVAAAMFEPQPLDVIEDLQVANPFGIGWLASPLHLLGQVSGPVLVAGSIASVVALIVRYRRSRGVERQQMRWFVVTAEATGLAFVVMVALTALGGSGGDDTASVIAFYVFALFLGVGIPVACAVAILRYRLWDLDIVIKKAVVFLVIAAGLTVLSVAILLSVPLFAVGELTWWERGLFIVGIAIGTTFGPLRRWARRVADRVVYGRRATPYEVLSEFASRIGGTYAGDDVTARMALLLREATGATVARVWLSSGTHQRQVAAAPTDAPAATWPVDGVEVHYRGELLGGLSVEMPANDPLNATRARLIGDLAGQAGPVLANVQLIEELRASRRRIVAAQDERAKKLERDIHDGAQQQLVALAVKQRLLGGLIGRGDVDRARALAEELTADTNDALENLRDLARGIYPPLLADKGLTAALEAQARKAAVPTSVETDGVGRLPQDMESAVYFSCLEALQNVAKYADATHARITLSSGSGGLRFSVADDGRGFDPASTDHGTGLQGIADRLAAIGGTLTVTSTPGHGTMVSGVVPA